MTSPSRTVTGWRAHLRALGRSPKTVQTRIGSVWAVANAIGCAPERLDAENLAAHFATTSYSSWTRRTYVISLRQYLTWSGRDDAAAVLHQAPPPRRVPNPLPEHEFDLLCGYTEGREHLWVLMGGFAGLRSHETAKARWEDLLRFGERWMLRVHGKGDTVDLIPLPPVLATALLAARPPSRRGYMFPSDANPSGHITPGWLSRLVRRRAAEIGVVMHYHRLRHRYGTAVHRARRDLLVTQQRLRHRDPASTAGYALIADDHGHAVVDELPGAIPAPRTGELETAA